MLHEERESAVPAQSLADLVPSAWELSRVARIFDDVACFCFDGDDPQLGLAVHSGYFGAGAHERKSTVDEPLPRRNACPWTRSVSEELKPSDSYGRYPF